MSLKALLENFGGKKTEEVGGLKHGVTEDTEVLQDVVEGESACKKCGGKTFWRHKNTWYCEQCKKPPTADFVHEVRGELREQEVAESVAVDAYDSVVVVEGAGACPDCPCRWVKETPYANGRLQRVCWSCGAEIGVDRHGGTGEFRELPFHLLPFWKWFNEK